MKHMIASLEIAHAFHRGYVAWIAHDTSTPLWRFSSAQIGQGSSTV